MAASPDISLAGLKFLERFEGFRSHMYCDAAGHCTIGFGHLVHRGGLGADTVSEAPFKHGISQIDAVTLLMEDVKKAETAIGLLVKVPLTQPQLDALVSFVYNVGIGAFEESTLLRVLNDGMLDAVPTEMARWNKTRHGQPVLGLTKRRVAEGKLFSSGDYGV